MALAALVSSRSTRSPRSPTALVILPDLGAKASASLESF